MLADKLGAVGTDGCMATMVEKSTLFEVRGFIWRSIGVDMHVI